MAGDLMMALANDYRAMPDPDSYSSDEAVQMALGSGKMPLESVPQSQDQAGAERLPADRLHNMYLSWETAKSTEIHSQWLASRYYHSKQWTDAEIRELERRKQPVTTKNRIKRKVDFLVGVEQRLRRDPKGFPRNPSGEKAAHVSTAALRYVADSTKWQAISSAASRDALIRGIGVIWQGIKIVKGQPEVRKHWVPADRFFYDPRSEQPDFSDARYLGEWQWLDMDEAMEMLPFAAETIQLLGSSGSNGSFSALPQEFDRHTEWHTWIDYKEQRIRVVLIWYKHKGSWLYDYLVGPMSLCAEEHDCQSPYMGEDDETSHPYTAWSPYIDERGDRYGVVRDMIPVQDEINKRSSKMLNMLSVRQTMGREGAILDIDKMKQEMARPDGHVVVNGGLDENFRIIDQSAQISGQFELLQEAKGELENLGPNPGLVGRGVERQSGRAILAQQNSGMTELSPVFEHLREWKLSVYRKDWNLIRQFWTDERYIRIADDPRAVEFLAVNRIVQDPETNQMQMENVLSEMDVDIILDEGPDTITMREELLEQLSQLGPEAVPAELMIELSAIPEKDMILKRLREAKAPPPELAALQERMAQLEQAAAAAKVDETIAKADATRADILKKRADTIKTMVETGFPPVLAGQEFPGETDPMSFINRLQQAASELDQAMQAQGGPEGPQQGDSGMPGQMMPPGNMPPPEPPDAFEGGFAQEPQFNQGGGLPVGQDVFG